MEQEIFIGYFIGTLSPQEEKTLLDWIDASDANRKEYLALRKVWDMYLLNRAAEAPSISFSQILAEYYRKLEAAKPSRPMMRIRELCRIAAIFAVAFGLGWYIHTRAQRKPEPVYHMIEVPPGQRAKLTLSDGSQVWLNAQTRFTYPAVFDKDDARCVMLDGEGLFEVAHNNRQPFRVQTANREVTALGTTFDVYAYSNSNAFETILLDGSVEIAPTRIAGQTYRLRPGNRLYYDEDARKMRIEKVNTGEYVSWKDGIYCFNDITFAEMTKRLGHYYMTRITILDSAVMNYRCTGKFRQHESITDIMNVVKSDMPFTYTYNKDLNELIINKRIRKR
ncbi:MAG: FecR domain-containing protein [Tannerella sp.]|jgi:ferric-dicitrate binding protein FerR (iron transport regulator)|nr:FecR domain-containing protein [Tannerella sp.]